MGRRALVLSFAFAVLLPGQTAAPTIPDWLPPYPGGFVTTEVSPGLTEYAYIVAATPAQVTEHYRQRFASANVVFAPNFDGLGTSVRASEPLCDLVLTIRPQGNQSKVKLRCAVKVAAAVSPATVPATGSSSGRASGSKLTTLPR